MQATVRPSLRRTLGTDPPPGLRIEDLTHRFGARRVVDGVSLVVPAGEIHCLVGPSGCGKTTTLRLIAGLEPIQAGRIWIGGVLVASPEGMLPPEQRRVGLMFQDFALFPHLRVAENVGFGLGGQDRRRREERVAELLRRVGLAAHARAYPHTLSGGEQQRVALARALAPAPGLMLLDEAFSALDATLRTAVRDETLAILRETATPTLLVTHDAEEAIRVGDRIHVMEAGRLVQSGSAADLYARPRDPFVASFFGAVNRFTGEVRGGRVATPIGMAAAPDLGEGRAVEVIVRPEGVRLRGAGDGGTAARVAGQRDLGPAHMLRLVLADGFCITVRREGPPTLGEGQEVVVDLDPAHVFVYPIGG